MKHLPNLLTLANLVCGCIAIVFILNAQPFLSAFNNREYWVIGTEQAYWGAYFIFFAAIFDVLDGMAARGLQIFSPLGKDLDSLADLVSFGVAPSMILFKFLWAAYMTEPYALDVSMLYMIPAFLPVCAGAIRLARYNQTADQQRNSFVGMPIPTAGLVLATLPLINWLNPEYGIYLQNKWVLYAIIVLVSWLMVSKFRFMKLFPSKPNLVKHWPQLVVLLTLVIGGIVIKIMVVPIAFILYILLSFIHKAEEA